LSAKEKAGTKNILLPRDWEWEKKCGEKGGKENKQPNLTSDSQVPLLFREGKKKGPHGP